MKFAHPGWLPLLILIPLLGLAAILTSRQRRRQWTEFMAPRLRDALLKKANTLPTWLALLFLLTACVALVIALARPRADAGTKLEKTLGRNVMIALDISRSMKVSDVKPDRLSQAKIVIYELLDAMPNERIGMIGFAGSPYVYAPLTIDHSAVREIVDQIDEQWAPLGGSDLASAVHLATETLKKTGQKNNALVILSDGEKHEGDMDAMIAEAEASGVYIIAVGVGTEDGGFVPNDEFPNGQMVDRSGQAVISRLQPAVMRKLAEETKGRFAVAGSGMDIPALVNSVVKDLDAFEMDGRERKVSIEFYQWLVLPAVLFLMISILAGTRWKGIKTAGALAAFMIFAPAAPANEATRAKEALVGKDYKTARKAYHELAEKSGSSETKARYRLGEAAAAYNEKAFREARTAYSQSLLSGDSMVDARGHLGMGNSLFQLGWQGLTGIPYPDEPGSVPDLDGFDAIVKKALAEMLDAEEPEDGETPGFGVFESLVMNWTDAVRHYDSTLALVPSDAVARKNKELAMIYLKRLSEVLKEEEEQTQQSMPQSQPGEGPPEEGEDGKEGDGEGEPGGKGKGGDKKKDGKGGDEKDKDADSGGKKKGEDKDKDGKGDKGKDPNESPQERARRLLKENADLERGPLTRGRREYINPEKDW
jgi:Ca-activated chloride channel family protein